MNRFLRIFILFLSELSGFAAAILAYESIGVFLGRTLVKPLWGIEIPLYYQTPELYAWYCAGWSAWFLAVCICGIIFCQRNYKWAAVTMATSFVFSLVIFILVNGRSHF
jgi:hypothetical protein